MTRLIPEKLHVKYLGGAAVDAPIAPRFFALTHSDSTGDLFLSIGSDYDKTQTSGLYTRLMRDEVLAELRGLTGFIAERLLPRQRRFCFWESKMEI
jgi:hypothetical protein